MQRYRKTNWSDSREKNRFLWTFSLAAIVFCDKLHFEGMNVSIGLSTSERHVMILVLSSLTLSNASKLSNVIFGYYKCEIVLKYLLTVFWYTGGFSLIKFSVWIFIVLFRLLAGTMFASSLVLLFKSRNYFFSFTLILEKLTGELR